jgi:hypothetical protein
MWLIPLFNEEGKLSSSFVLECRLLIVNYKYLFVLVILVVVYIRPQVLVEVLVDNFYLAVSLQMVCCQQLEFSIYASAKLILEVQYKLRSSIRYNRIWYANMLYDIY